MKRDSLNTKTICLRLQLKNICLPPSMKSGLKIDKAVWLCKFVTDSVQYIELIGIKYSPWGKNECGHSSLKSLVSTLVDAHVMK